MISPDDSIDRSCGPSGCELDWLSSPRHVADDDVVAFTSFAAGRGWGDGLPLIPPTEERVRAFLSACERFPDELIAKLPPLGGEATVEKIAINAVMAGAAPEAMGLLIAAVEAVASESFNLAAVSATTGSVVPALVVNGPQRDLLDVPYQAGCFGGMTSAAPAIGRALRLIIRNVAGQVSGVTSQSVFGQPGRVAGIVVGEWEERSPWPSLAERRGVQGNAVTAFGAMGTLNVVDPLSDPDILLTQIGRSMGYPGANGFANAITYSEVLVAVNPVWAGFLAERYPDAADVQRELWRHTGRPLESWPAEYHRWFREGGRVEPDGLVHLVPSPDQVLLMVCGGLGGLHATVLHGWGETTAATVPVQGG